MLIPPPNRRSSLTSMWLLRCYALVLLLIGCAACRRKGDQSPSTAPPRDANLLLITLDTTRADHLSCYGRRGAKTPHLDALAARGARFTRAVAQVPLTLPSHACIMTGAYPEVHGLRDMGGFILAKTHPTIASITRPAGFATAAFLGSRVLSRSFGLSNGFSTYDDEMGTPAEEGRLPGVFPERRASVVTDRALDWLRQNANGKFFLWVHYYDPHAPYDPPEPYKHTYAQDLYSGEIAYTDEQVGRLLAGLDQLGLSSRTLIAVMGDHGESLGEHGEMTHGIFLYDSTLHVPLILAGPDVPPGKVIDDQVRSIDLMPTLLAFLNLSPGPEAQGASLWPLITQGRRVRSDYAYCETLYPRTYMGWSELRAMRTDSWKLIVAPRPELYNLERDPAETTNLIARYPADADHLQKKVWEVAGEQARKEKVLTTPVDPETRQELESLGYVSAGTPREIRLGTAAPDPKDRTDVLKTLEQVEGLLNQESYARAAQLMEQALKRDPTNPLGLLYLATAFEKMGRYQRAVQVYEHAIDLRLGTDQIYSRLGRVYLRLRQVDKAADAMARANEINPTDLDNLRNLGTAYLQLGRPNDAEKAFKAITLQNDRYAAAYNGLGLIAVRRGDGDSARQNFEKALELDPGQVEPLLNLGVLYQKAGNKEQALRYLKMFLEKAPRQQYGSLLPQVREAIQKLSRGSEGE
jgi:choline-sulfatase